MSLPAIRTKRSLDCPPANVLMLEQHFALAELAERWAVSIDYVTGLFQDEPGVIRSPGGKKRRVMRIPASVVARVYQRMLEAGR